jgi:hypothetical protein
LVAALPPPDQVIVRKTGDLIEFKVPVVSEDAGDRLLGVLQLDTGSGTTNEDDNLAVSFAPPSTLDAANPRVLNLAWEVRSFVMPGCHRFTLRVSHSLNFTTIPDVEDPKDVAEAYWFANIDQDTDGTLVNCPGASSGGL